jgi:hypothetical protein
MTTALSSLPEFQRRPTSSNKGNALRKYHMLDKVFRLSGQENKIVGLMLICSILNPGSSILEFPISTTQRQLLADSTEQCRV